MPLRTAPEPLDVDAVNVVTAGTALWGLVGLGLLLLGRGWLADTGRLHWLGVCAAGFGLGLAGIAYCRRRRARLGRQAAARGD
jgi:hypothetical protein